MNVFLPEFLREALAERADAVLPCGEGTGEHVPAEARGGPGEDECPSGAVLVEHVLFQGQDDLPREREPGGDVNFKRRLDVLLCDCKERPEDVDANIPQRHTQLCLLWRGPCMPQVLVEYLRHGGVAVSRNVKGGGLEIREPIVSHSTLLPHHPADV